MIIKNKIQKWPSLLNHSHRLKCLIILGLLARQTQSYIYNLISAIKKKKKKEPFQLQHQSCTAPHLAQIIFRQ